MIIYNDWKNNMAQEEIKLSDIKNMFPLEGEYIFRFKYKLNNAVVWMDINEDSKIPLFNSKIMMKATRISWEGRPRQSQPQVEKRPKLQLIKTRKAEPQRTQQPNFTDSVSNDFSLLGGSTTSTKPTQDNRQNSGSFESINLLSTAQPQSHPKQSGGHDHDLLGGFTSSASGNTNTQQSSNKKTGDLLSFDNLF